jgi:hypothetical protein
VALAQQQAFFPRQFRVYNFSICAARFFQQGRIEIKPLRQITVAVACLSAFRPVTVLTNQSGEIKNDLALG